MEAGPQSELMLSDSQALIAQASCTQSQIFFTWECSEEIAILREYSSFSFNGCEATTLGNDGCQPSKRLLPRSKGPEELALQRVERGCAGLINHIEKRTDFPLRLVISAVLSHTLLSIKLIKM